MRGIGGTAGLFAGTLLAGAAVAIAQTVVPILVRVGFSAHTGVLTGVFSAALTVGAALAAATAVPLADALGGWAAALAAYALPALAGLVLWLVWVHGSTRVHRGPPVGLSQSGRSWSVAVFFGLQSMAFYAGLTWLPSILRSHGYSDAAAGGLQALGNALQFVPALAVPILAGRRETQTLVLVILVAGAAAGFAGLIVAPGAAALWVCVVGLAQGGCLGLALVLPVLRGRGARAVAGLTAMTLSVGYLIAAWGPSLVGLAHDVVGGWNVVLACLIGITLAELAPGVFATRAWSIGAEER
jgi:CP family cyanate transporter-like MFS transporter